MILTGIPRGPAGPAGPASPWQWNQQTVQKVNRCMYSTAPTIAPPKCAFECILLVCGVALCVTHPQPWFPIFSIQSLNARGTLSLETRSVEMIFFFFILHTCALEVVKLGWYNMHIPSVQGSLESLRAPLGPEILECRHCPSKSKNIQYSNHQEYFGCRKMS